MAFTFVMNAQVGIFTTNPNASAELDISAPNKGLLIPRIVLSGSLSSPSPIDSPTEGLIIFNTSGPQLQGFYYWHNNSWLLLKTPNSEEVVGPSTSTDNSAVRFDGTSGKIIQNSSVTINDSDQISGVNNINLDYFTMNTAPSDGKILVSDASGNASWDNAPPIDVKKNNSLITANVKDLNFEGVKVKDEGNNSAKIIFYKNNVTKDVIQMTSSDSTDLNSLSSVTPINWNIEEHKDASSFTHSTSINPNRITVKVSGVYELNYMFSAINRTIKRKTLRTRIRKNGSTFMGHITSYSFSYHEADDKITHSSSSFLIQLQQNDYIELVVNGQTNEGPIRLLPYENIFFMRLIREL